MYDCRVESHESTRQRAESLQTKTNEDRIAGRGFASMTRNNLVHRFIPMPQAMKIRYAKVAVDKEWKKARDNSSMGFEKSQRRKETTWESTLLHWWTCTTLRNVQDFFGDGKTPFERRCGEPFSEPIIPCGAMVEHHSISAETSQGSINLVRKFYLEYFLDMHCMRREFGKELFWSQTSRSWQILDASEIHARETHCERGPHAEEWWPFHIPDRRWTSQVVWQRAGVPKIHLNPGLPCTRRRAQRRSSRRVGWVSTVRHADGWRWSPKRCLDDRRELHSSSSRWTKS